MSTSADKVAALQDAPKPRSPFKCLKLDISMLKNTKVVQAKDESNTEHKPSAAEDNKVVIVPGPFRPAKRSVVKGHATYPAPNSEDTLVIAGPFTQDSVYPILSNVLGKRRTRCEYGEDHDVEDEKILPASKRRLLSSGTIVEVTSCNIPAVATPATTASTDLTSAHAQASTVPIDVAKDSATPEPAVEVPSAAVAGAPPESKPVLAVEDHITSEIYLAASQPSTAGTEVHCTEPSVPDVVEQAIDTAGKPIAVPVAADACDHKEMKTTSTASENNGSSHSAAPETPLTTAVHVMVPHTVPGATPNGAVSPVGSDLGAGLQTQPAPDAALATEAAAVDPTASSDTTVEHDLGQGVFSGELAQPIENPTSSNSQESLPALADPQASLASEVVAADPAVAPESKGSDAGFRSIPAKSAALHVDPASSGASSANQDVSGLPADTASDPSLQDRMDMTSNSASTDEQMSSEAPQSTPPSSQSSGYHLDSPINAPSFGYSSAQQSPVQESIERDVSMDSDSEAPDDVSMDPDSESDEPDDVSMDPDSDMDKTDDDADDDKSISPESADEDAIATDTDEMDDVRGVEQGTNDVGSNQQTSVQPTLPQQHSASRAPAPSPETPGNTLQVTVSAAGSESHNRGTKRRQPIESYPAEREEISSGSDHEDPRNSPSASKRARIQSQKNSKQAPGLQGKRIQPKALQRASRTANEETQSSRLKRRGRASIATQSKASSKVKDTLGTSPQVSLPAISSGTLPTTEASDPKKPESESYQRQTQNEAFKQQRPLGGTFVQPRPRPGSKPDAQENQQICEQIKANIARRDAKAKLAARDADANHARPDPKAKLARRDAHRKARAAPAAAAKIVNRDAERRSMPTAPSSIKKLSAAKSSAEKHESVTRARMKAPKPRNIPLISSAGDPSDMFGMANGPEYAASQLFAYAQAHPVSMADLADADEIVQAGAPNDARPSDEDHSASEDENEESIFKLVNTSAGNGSKEKQTQLPPLQPFGMAMKQTGKSKKYSFEGYSHEIEHDREWCEDRFAAWSKAYKNRLQRQTQKRQAEKQREQKQADEDFHARATADPSRYQAYRGAAAQDFEGEDHENDTDLDEDKIVVEKNTDDADSNTDESTPEATDESAERDNEYYRMQANDLVAAFTNCFDMHSDSTELLFDVSALKTYKLEVSQANRDVYQSNATNQEVEDKIENQGLADRMCQDDLKQLRNLWQMVKFPYYLQASMYLKYRRALFERQHENQLNTISIGDLVGFKMWWSLAKHLAKRFLEQHPVALWSEGFMGYDVKSVWLTHPDNSLQLDPRGLPMSTNKRVARFEDGRISMKAHMDERECSGLSGADASVALNIVTYQIALDEAPDWVFSELATTIEKQSMNELDDSFSKVWSALGRD